jgi:hypothetical protein
MDGVVAVVFLVRCATSLLLCDTVPTEHLRFDDMERCRGAASRLLEKRRRLSGSEVWMAKCRYQLASPDSRPRSRHAQTAPGSSIDVTERAPR